MMLKAFAHDEHIKFEVHGIKANLPIGFVFGLGSTMGFVVGVIIVHQVLATDVGAHMGEHATFWAVENCQGCLLGVVFEEALILSLIGFVPNVGVAMGLCQLTSWAMGLLLVMPLAQVIGSFIATIAMCALLHLCLCTLSCASLLFSSHCQCMPSFVSWCTVLCTFFHSLSAVVAVIFLCCLVLSCGSCCCLVFGTLQWLSFLVLLALLQECVILSIQ